jgi:hypothetical protein
MIPPGSLKINSPGQVLSYLGADRYPALKVHTTASECMGRLSARGGTAPQAFGGENIESIKPRRGRRRALKELASIR